VGAKQDYACSKKRACWMKLVHLRQKMHRPRQSLVLEYGETILQVFLDRFSLEYLTTCIVLLKLLGVWNGAIAFDESK
jgi:hypothetical protein